MALTRKAFLGCGRIMSQKTKKKEFRMSRSQESTLKRKLSEPQKKTKTQ